MIFCNQASFSRYFSVHPAFPKAFAALSALAAEPFAAGRHDVDGALLYINAISYDTKPAEDAFYEAHRKYLDVMLMLEGEERVCFRDVRTLQEITSPYEEQGDSLLAAMDGGENSVRLSAGDMAVFFPEDAHAPGINWKEKSGVRKLVAKVLL